MSETERLHELARAYGIKTAYWDIAGRERQATPHSLLATLRALGAPVETAADVDDALREHEQSRWRKLCEPVFTARDGQPLEVELRLPVKRPGGTAQCRLQLEDGRRLQWAFEPGELPPVNGETVEGAAYETRRLTLPGGWPHGYHRMTLSVPGCGGEALVITAPDRAYALPSQERIWGVFLPLYALHSARSGATGDLTDLEALLEWTGGMGGKVVGTLPLLPAFLDEPFDASPYAPVSRLFWNEFYLDLDRVGEVRDRPEIRSLLLAADYQREMADLKAADLVDYRRAMALKRRVLESCARLFFAGDGRRRAALEQWADDHPFARDYARFRAAQECRGATWPVWPARMRDGDLREGDYDPATARYHLYVQWLVSRQLQQVSAKAVGAGAGLYLDLPLGVHGAGYDVWRERAAFAPGADTGAPPDPFNMAGQNWAFAPPHPENTREQGYRYYIACLRHHLRRAGVLRIDHAAGLRRLFWIPRGLPANEGVYVRYREEEYLAILALESHRHRALIVGEDLGTVPDSFRQALARRRIYGMYVVPFELTGREEPVLNPVRPDCLACLNTHDMEPFASFWKGRGDTAGTETGTALPTYLHRRGWLKTPAAETGAVLQGLLADLAAGPAGVVQVNLEDLWLETRPQNRPGVGHEYPNWRRKARYSIEEFTKMEGVVETLHKIDKLRGKPLKEG